VAFFAPVIVMATARMIGTRQITGRIRPFSLLLIVLIVIRCPRTVSRQNETCGMHVNTRRCKLFVFRQLTVFRRMYQPASQRIGAMQ
jgi:hypothetical protein